MSINNEVKIYVKNIKKRLLYNTKESKQYLKNLETNIMEYIDEFQVTDIASIKSHFGSEEEIANAYFEQYNESEIKKKLKIRNMIIACAVVVALIFSVCIIYKTIDSQNSSADTLYIFESQEDITHT